MLKIGHRGAPGYPRVGENTIWSFTKALWSGADAIEFDIRLTKDEKVVVVHDGDLNRVTDGVSKEKIADLYDHEFMRYDVGFGEHVPLFSAVLKNFRKSRLLFCAELKVRGLDRILHTLVHVVSEEKDFDLDGRIIFSAFDEDDNDPDASSSWQELSNLQVDFPIALLASKEKIERLGEDGFVEVALHYRASAINPEKEAVTQSLVSRARTAGLGVNVWTVNNILQIDMLREMSVTGIFSDFPELL